MKAIRCELLGLVMALAIGLPSAVHAADSVSDPSVCIDGMETVPGDDEQEPILAAMDGGCTAPQGPISV